jgi:type III secretion protein Q
MSIMTTQQTLAALTGNEATARSKIARHVVDLEVPALSSPEAAVSLSLEPLGHQGRAALTDGRWLEFEWGGARLVVEIPAAGLAAWLRGSLGGVEPAVLPEMWHCIAQSRAVRSLLRALGASGRGQGQLTHASNKPSTDTPSHVFAFAVRLAPSGEVVHGRVYLDGLGLLLAASLVPLIPPPSGFGGTPSVPVMARLLLGHSVLGYKDLRTLGHGDVILIHQRSVDAVGGLIVRVGTDGDAWGLKARLDTNGLNILDSARPLMTDETSETTSASLPLDELPIRLSFDLGDVVVPLRELLQMRPGETLALQRPVDEGVTIRANGASVGTGYLVDIDGRLGVCLVSLKLKGDTPRLGDMSGEA